MANQRAKSHPRTFLSIGRNMPKPQLSLDDHYENDFGFSAVSEDDLKELERRLQQEVIQKEKQLISPPKNIRRGWKRYTS